MTRTFTVDCPAPGCDGDSDCPICHGGGQAVTDTCPTCEGARNVEKASPGYDDPYHTVSVRCPTCLED